MGRSANTGLLDSFTAYLLQEGRKPSTIRLLTHKLKRMVGLGVGLTEKEINTFLLSQKHKISSSSYNCYVDLVRVYANYCKYNNLPYDIELHKIPFIKDRYRPRATMSDKEIEDFLALPREGNTGRIKHEYWNVFFSIMAYTGMRTGEVAKLRVENVDFSQGVFYLLDTKTNEDRIVPIPPNIKDSVLSWVDHIGKGFLFPSTRPDGHCSSVEWGYQFHARTRRLGINRPNLTPYSLRHSYITEMLQTEGVNIFDVKNLVGHHDTRTTENYYHLTTKRLKAVVGKHPSVRKYTSVSEVFGSIEEFIKNLNLGENYLVEKNIKNNKLVVKIESLFQK